MNNKIINYALGKQLIEKRDINYVNNQIANILGIEPTKIEISYCHEHIQEILNELTMDEYKQSLIMNVLMPSPSIFEKEFYRKDDPLKWFYQTMIDVNYIKTQSLDKNISFISKSKYGKIEIAINFSKPEKDPKEIARLRKLAIKTYYPKCLLCVENEGYYGRVNWPDRSNHRMVKIEINNDGWYLQYSPYQYYNHHAILLNEKHSDMKINRSTFDDLFDFVDLYPEYFIGSNAELPIVGGSILNHAHYQCGKYTFPMNNASAIECYVKDDVRCEIINWPLSTIKLTGKKRHKIIDIADDILEKWRTYTNEKLNIYASTDELHNTITPILFKDEDNYELYIVLRNNLTSEEHPFGIFHPHIDKHHIKKENIGLIEVMGLAILPPRLGELYDSLEKGCFLNGKTIFQKEELEEEIGQTFEKILEDCGVFLNEEKEFKIFLQEALENVN